ncbi:MAG: single-stranded DNA-binding protein [Clostridia bacterium]|nr:single-stranded DNA-binding protein [Clostridia bacterium]
MNRIFLIGNLTRDPELTQTATGIAVCRFSLAVSRDYKSESGEKITDFFDCTAWRGLAETVAKYCRKGMKMAVEGSVGLRNYEDKNGVKRLAVDVTVSDVEFLSSKTDMDKIDPEYEATHQVPRKPAGNSQYGNYGNKQSGNSYSRQRPNYGNNGNGGADPDIPF